MDNRLLGLVECLYRASDHAMALVSGRSIADIDRLFGRPDIPAAGQHGLERRNSAGVTERTVKNDRDLAAIAASLRALVRHRPALLLEDKGLSLAVHFRRAPSLAGYLHRYVRNCVAGYPDFVIQRGKHVLEIRPAGTDKGSAIEAYLSETPFRGRTPVFIGDDITDEHGFSVVNALSGISIKIGRGRSRAKYRLPDVTAVRSWLGRAALAACA